MLDFPRIVSDYIVLICWHFVVESGVGKSEVYLISAQLDRQYCTRFYFTLPLAHFYTYSIGGFYLYYYYVDLHTVELANNFITTSIYTIFGPFYSGMLLFVACSREILFCCCCYSSMMTIINFPSVLPLFAFPFQNVLKMLH
jgi:hypothetical protein